MFSTSALTLYLGYALLLGAMIVGNRRVRWLIAAAAAAFGIHSVHVHSEWIAAIPAAAIVVSGVGFGFYALLRNRFARFSIEDTAIRDGLLVGVSAAAARHFIDRGYWISGETGETLAREGQQSAYLVYLFAGDAAVTVAGRRIATCHAGDVIGEANILAGEPACATIVLETPARFWCAEAGLLRAYIAANEDIRGAIGRNLSQVMRRKLLETSRAPVMATA